MKITCIFLKPATVETVFFLYEQWIEARQEEERIEKEMKRQILRNAKKATISVSDGGRKLKRGTGEGK